MISSSSLWTYRVLSLGLAFAISAAGLLLTRLPPAETDPLWIRWLISAWFLGLFGVSLHTVYRKLLPRLWNISVWGGSIWYLGIALLNEFSLPYATGALVLLPVGGSILQLTDDNFSTVRWYYGLGSVAMSGAVFMSDMPTSLEAAYLVCMVVLVLAIYATQHGQRRAEMKLRSSRRKYKSLFDTATDAVLVHDLEGRITDVNPQAEELFGYSADALVGRHLANLHSRESKEGIQRQLETLRDGQELRGQARYIRRNGSTFWGDLSASVVDVNGDAVARSMIRDVTDERILRKRLQEERDLLSKVLETSPVAITIVAHDGTITFANSQAEDVLGLGRSEIKDRTYHDPDWQITDADGSEFPEEELPFAQVMATGRPVFGVEHAIEWPDGERRLLSINGAPFQVEDGSIKSAVFALEDITERREIETALHESRRRLQALFDHALDVILLADDDGRYVEVNPAAEQVLGYSRDELVDMSLWDLTPGTVEEGKRAWKTFLETGQMEGEYQLLTKNGEMVDMEFRAVADIQPGLHLSVLRDVTGRKRLEEQADRFFSLTLDLLCIADSEGQFLRINPAFQEVLGYSEEELLEQPFLEFIHSDDRAATRAAVEKLSNGNDIQKFVNRYRHKNGGYRWIEWHATPDPNGELIYAAARDITDRREYERRLKSAKEKAEEMNRLKSSFLANMSHEIRTPLTSIIGYADLLKEQISPDDHRFVNRIEESGHRLLGTLNSVLDLAQLESGNVKVTPQIFDGAEELRRTAHQLQLQASRKELDLRLELPTRPLPVRMDKGILSRIVTNLLGNAVKFTEEGYVRLGCRRSGEQLIIEVEDTGIGMSEEFLEELYEAFRQESTGMSRQYEGNGLGLAITRHLVDLLDGRIEVESQKGEGTTFTVSLPRRLTDRNDTNDSSTSRPAEEKPGLAEARRVLIVDDDPAVAELLTQMLPDSYTFDTAGTAEEALALAERTTYDLIFQDINLKSETNGRQVREQMEQMNVLSDTRTIAITAYALPGDRKKLLDEGFDGYIAKPFDRELLFERLGEIIG